MLLKINPPAGATTQETDYTSGPRWVDMDKARFRYGKPEKIGGWETFISDQIEGVPRSAHSWTELDGIRDIAIGTECKLYVATNSTISDITPLRVSGHTLGSSDVATTNTSSTVEVTYTSHGAGVGAELIFESSLAVGGLTLDGAYTITAVPDANTIEFDAGSAATSTATGGSVDISLTINCGTSAAAAGFGWGTGTWGQSTWGTPRATSTVTLNMRVWSLDNYGEDLIASYRNGPLYYWDSSAGGRASAVTGTQVPDAVGLVRTIDSARHVVAFGASPQGSSTYDPLLIRWSDQDDYTYWDITNDLKAAGSKRLSLGNRITAATTTRSQTLIWTDAAVYSMVYAGPPFYFNFQQIGSAAPAVGPNAVATIEDIAVWMGTKNFYIYDGSVRTLDCPIHNTVFSPIFDETNAEKVFAAVNSRFNEVWWFYPTTDTNENTSYVIFNYKENTWSFGTLARTTWIPEGIYSFPLATDPTGIIYKHESTSDADGSPMESYVETGVFEMGGADGVGFGDNLIFVDKLVPDATLNDGATMSVTVYTKRYPNSPEIVKGPFSYTNTTQKISMRARGRQIRYRFSSSDAGNNWRLGTFRMDAHPMGKK
jgi:hypothetical protein